MMSALTETPLGLSSPWCKSTGSDCCNVGVQRIHVDFYRRDRPKQTCKGDATCDEGSKALNGTIRDILHNDCLIARSEGLLSTHVYATLLQFPSVSISFLACVELSTCRGSMMRCSMRIAVYGVKSCLGGSFAASTAYHLRYHGVLSMSQA